MWIREPLTEDEEEEKYIDEGWEMILRLDCDWEICDVKLSVYQFTIPGLCIRLTANQDLGFGYSLLSYLT